MQQSNVIRERLSSLETMKNALLHPPVIMYTSYDKPDLSLTPGALRGHNATVSQMAIGATLESLNAEIAALTWVLGEESGA